MTFAIGFILDGEAFVSQHGRSWSDRPTAEAALRDERRRTTHGLANVTAIAPPVLVDLYSLKTCGPAHWRLGGRSGCVEAGAPVQPVSYKGDAA